MNERTITCNEWIINEWMKEWINESMNHSFINKGRNDELMYQWVRNDMRPIMDRWCLTFSSSTWHISNFIFLYSCSDIPRQLLQTLLKIMAMIILMNKNCY